MASIEEAIAAFKAGQFVLVADDFDRENEGDLILAAEAATPQALAFMTRYTTGIVCVPLTGERLDELQLPQMVQHNTECNRTAFTVSVDYKHNTTTGVSASDRANTIKALISPDAKSSDFNRPGHVFPLRYREGGVLKRAGHTEATVDLARLAGLYPAGVIGEVVNDDGSMARMDDLKAFSEKHQIPLITVEDLVRYRRSREKIVRHLSETRIPTKHGEFTMHLYESLLDGSQHIALTKGNVKGQSNVMVRVHSECFTGDIFGSLRCDCGEQLNIAMKMIAAEGSGVVIYLRGHEGRGIGLEHKLRAYNLQDQGHDTVEANLQMGFPADTREYGIGAQMLTDLGVTTIRLMTNNPAKYGGLSGYDLQIVERIPLVCEHNKENLKYLMTKKEKMGHLLNL